MAKSNEGGAPLSSEQVTQVKAEAQKLGEELLGSQTGTEVTIPSAKETEPTLVSVPAETSVQDGLVGFGREEELPRFRVKAGSAPMPASGAVAEAPAEKIPASLAFEIEKRKNNIRGLKMSVEQLRAGKTPLLTI